MTNRPDTDNNQIEGGFTMFIGLIAPFFVPKFPDATTWLSSDQRMYLYHKLEEDRGHFKTATMTWKSFLKTTQEPMLWLQGSIYGFNVGTANAIGFFTPTIITVGDMLPQQPRL